MLCGLDRTGALDFERSGEQLLGDVGGFQRTLASRGVVPGDRVGVDVPRGPLLLPAHLAVLACGACVVPVNPALSARERSRLLERAELRTLIGPDDTPGAAAPPSLAQRDPTRPALLIFTSGTTGEPKGVPHTERGLEANLDGLARTWGLSDADRLLHALPAHHVHGLVLALYGSARLGMPIVMLERFDADLCVESFERHEIGVFMGVPTMYHRLAAAPRARPIESMRLYVSGSAPLAPADFAEFERRFGSRPLERYGLTETLIVTSNPLEAERRPGTVGQPLPETEVRLAADAEIRVRGPAVMPGYWQDPEASAEAFEQDWFRTGDLGHFDADGYLVISGRKKELIIVGGSNVLPGEVERALSGDAEVDELAAAGVADADRGEVVAAFVVPREGADPAEVERRLRAAKRFLGRGGTGTR
jgi:malonyl-CoA/methylmalonyl-CoA synthetase